MKLIKIRLWTLYFGIQFLMGLFFLFVSGLFMCDRDLCFEREMFILCSFFNCFSSATLYALILGAWFPLLIFFCLFCYRFLWYPVYLPWIIYITFFDHILVLLWVRHSHSMLLMANNKINGELYFYLISPLSSLLSHLSSLKFRTSRIGGYLDTPEKISFVVS